MTAQQQIAFQELQVKRQKEGVLKPTLTEVMLEGFKALLEREGLSGAELERIFPKQGKRKAPVRIISKKQRS